MAYGTGKVGETPPGSTLTTPARQLQVIRHKRPVRSPEKVFEKSLKKRTKGVMYVRDKDYRLHVFIPTSATLDKPMTIKVMVFAHSFLNLYDSIQIRLLKEWLKEPYPSTSEISSDDFLKGLIKLTEHEGSKLELSELMPDLWSLHLAKDLRVITMNRLQTQKLLDKNVSFHNARNSIEGQPVLNCYRSVKIIEINEDFILDLHQGAIKRFTIDKIYLDQGQWHPTPYEITLTNVQGGIYLQTTQEEEYASSPIEGLPTDIVDAKTRKAYTKRQSPKLAQKPKLLSLRDSMSYGPMDIEPPTQSYDKPVEASISMNNDSNSFTPTHALFAETIEQAQAMVGKEMKIQTAGGQTITLTVTSAMPALHEHSDIKDIHSEVKEIGDRHE